MDNTSQIQISKIESTPERINDLSDLNIFTSAPRPISLISKKNCDLSNLVFAIKDNICTRDFPTTAASNILKDHCPTYNATVVERILASGGTIIGKTNMDEFAMGSSSEFSIHGAVKNPLNSSYSAGGSSGGSAASIASNLCDISIGSDTGGSVRQPASFCGVMGFKPSYGMISRYGLIAFASSLDTIGIFSKDVSLIEKAFSVIGGKDTHDTTSKDFSILGTSSNSFNYNDITIGILEQNFLDTCSIKVKLKYRILIENMQDLGIKTKSIDLPYFKHWLSAYHVIASAEASSNLARYVGNRLNIEQDKISNYRSKNLGNEVKKRILLGTYVLSKDKYNSYYMKSMNLREAIKQSFSTIFNSVDFVLTPTTPTRAFELGAYKSNPVAYYGTDQYLVGPSLAGLPAISLPYFAKNDDLPYGFQLVANRYNDLNLLKVSDYLLKNLLR
jgi:aspartyl-tRNA(Asn)/glutamyl-tRNA(Gln) amidotransferase subunit A